MKLSAMFFGVVLLASGVAHAERSLTLAEALIMARTQNRDLKAARARLDQARAAVENARAALLPQVSAQGKYTHNYKEVTLDVSQFTASTVGLADTIQATSGNAAQNAAIDVFKQALAEAASAQGAIVIQKQEQLDFQLAANVPLVVPSAYPALNAARGIQRAADASFRVGETQLLYGTAQAFFADAGAAELVQARTHAVQVAKKTRDDAQSRFSAGLVNRVELMRAQVALDRAEQAQVEATDMQAQAHAALATLLSLREPFVVVSGDDPAVRNFIVDELAKQAMTGRPEIAALELNLSASRSNKNAAAWRWAPTLSAFGVLRATNYKGFNGDNYLWAVGAQLDWVLYDGGYRDAQRRVFNADRSSQELQLAQLRDSVRDEVQNAERALTTKRRALATAKRAAELSAATLELVRSQHEAGTATQLDLLQAQDMLVGAEVLRAQARFDLQLADLQLKRASGTFPAQSDKDSAP